MAGACLGLGFLSKYAAVYFLIGAALAAALRRGARPALRDAVLAAAAFGLVILPNILWNVAHGGSTVEHTLDNASWVRDPAGQAALNFDKLAEFLGAQFLVFGPVLFGALLWSVWRAIRGRAGRAEMLMLIFALPVLALVSGQAILSRAYANWAVTAYIAGTLAVVPLLCARAPRWLVGSFVFNGALALAVPLAMVYAESFAWDGKPVLSRVLGRVEISERIIDMAEESGAETVVAVHRDILADLFHTGRDSGLSFRAVRGDGPPEHHYEMSYPYDGQAADPVLLVLLGTTPPGCPHELADGWTGGTGAFEGYEFRAWLVAPDCPSLGRF